MVLVSAGWYSLPTDVCCNGLLFCRVLAFQMFGIGDSYLELRSVVLRMISHCVDIWGSYCYGNIVADTSV